MDLEREVGRQIRMSHFIVGRKIEIGGIFAGAGGGIDIDFQLDADRPGLACPGKDKVELAGDRIILEERLADRAVHFRLGPRVELQAELAEHVDQNREIRRPIEIRSEEQTSEIQSLMRISYAVFCLKKTKHTRHHVTNTQHHRHPHTYYEYQTEDNTQNE